MDNKRYFDILRKVYHLTDDVTPRSFDCGELCQKRCCGNLSKDGGNSGMMLLPYEKEYLINEGASYRYEKNDDGDILICDGKCERGLRPFACRIFPYYIETKDGKIHIKKDLRAASVCPLLVTRVRRRPNIYFLRNIKKAAKLLLKEDCFKDELSGIADFIGCLYELYTKMEQ